MTKPSYLISRNRQSKAFFTSSSAFDRPSWVSLTEATKYHDAETAQRALKKLLGYGAFEARLIPFEEAMELTLPQDDQSLPQDDAPVDAAMDPNAPDDLDGVSQADVPADDEMSADDTTEVCPECDHEPCTCDTDTDGVDDEVDAILSKGEFDGKDIADRQALDKDLADRLPFKESTEVIKFKDPSQLTPADTELASSGDTKVRVPTAIMTSIHKVVVAAKAEAAKFKDRDDARASFQLTIASAFASLEDCLSAGTTDGLKRAQIEMSSWMSPIQQYLPSDVQSFIQLGGRSPSLKDMFNAKRSEVKESLNHMDERTQSTYSGWKKACQRKYPGCTFRGDEDIGAAVLNGRDVGEWDGVEGCVFNQQQKD